MVQRQRSRRPTIFFFISSIFLRRNAHWTSKITINADFVKAMTDIELSAVEVQLGIDVYGFIESRKELGATTTMLKAKYEDREFLEKVLDIMVDMKMIMKTGVCQLTYVHRSFVKPWIVNTYHLKRLNRVSSTLSSISTHFDFRDFNFVAGGSASDIDEIDANRQQSVNAERTEAEIAGRCVEPGFVAKEKGSQSGW